MYWLEHTEHYIDITQDNMYQNKTYNSYRDYHDFTQHNKWSLTITKIY